MDSVRERIRSFLKLSPRSPVPTVTLMDRTDADGFTRSSIQYSAPEGDRVEAYLFQPAKERPAGAVLALHQHNSQWAIGKSEIAGSMGDPLQAFGPALARRGLTVLAPDAIGFESRLKTTGSGTSLAPPLHRQYSTADGWLQYYNEMAHRLVQGDLLMRKVLDDCAVALSVLQRYSGSQNIGTIGHSFGGIVTLFLAALDTRVAFACTSGAVCSFRHKLEHGIGLEMSLIIPSFTEQFEIADLIRCVAPRKLLVISAEDDPQTADAENLVRKARPAFEAQRCANHLEHLHVPGTHALDQRRFEAIIDWSVAQSL